MGQKARSPCSTPASPLTIDRTPDRASSKASSSQSVMSSSGNSNASGQSPSRDQNRSRKGKEPKSGDPGLGLSPAKAAQRQESYQDTGSGDQAAPQRCSKLYDDKMGRFPQERTQECQLLYEIACINTNFASYVHTMVLLILSVIWHDVPR